MKPAVAGGASPTRSRSPPGIRVGLAHEGIADGGDAERPRVFLVWGHGRFSQRVFAVGSQSSGSGSAATAVLVRDTNSPLWMDSDMDTMASTT